LVRRSVRRTGQSGILRRAGGNASVGHSAALTFEVLDGTSENQNRLAEVAALIVD
jgi:hypothetical protein